jgi:hypothetical protein
MRSSNDGPPHVPRWHGCGNPRRAAGRQTRWALAKRGHDLLRALGFSIEPSDCATSILRAGDRKVAVAVLLARDEAPELSGERFSGLSPVSYALAVADREGLPWVVVQHGAKVRVHLDRRFLYQVE